MKSYDEAGLSINVCLDWRNRRILRISSDYFVVTKRDGLRAARFQQMVEESRSLNQSKRLSRKRYCVDFNADFEKTLSPRDS